MFDWGDFWAAAAGALAAFAFEGVRRWRDRHQAEQDAANAALLTLSQMYSTIFNFKEQLYDEQTAHIRKLKVRDPHAIELLPIAGVSDFGLRLDMSSLGFLLRTHDPDIANRLAVVERSYVTNISVEKLRFELHVQIQTLLSNAGVPSPANLSVEDLKKIAGISNVTQLEHITTAQLRNIPETCSRLLSIQAQLAEVVSLHFPTRRFIKFEPAKDPSIDRKAGRQAARWRRSLRWLFRRLRKLAS